MSRSGYSDDCDDNWAMIRWRGYVASAIRGKRGQAFLREMLAALDAMPEKRLIANDLEQADGCVCAIGAVGKTRGVDMSVLDPEDSAAVAHAFGINEKLVQEIVFLNDESEWWERDENGNPIREGDTFKRITPEGRWRAMRKWVARQIKDDTPSSAKVSA